MQGKLTKITVETGSGSRGDSGIALLDIRSCRIASDQLGRHLLVSSIVIHDQEMVRRDQLKVAGVPAANFKLSSQPRLALDKVSQVSFWRPPSSPFP